MSYIAKSLNLNELKFETLYQIDECHRSASPYNAHQSGEKMAVYSENEILLTTEISELIQKRKI